MYWSQSTRLAPRLVSTVEVMREAGGGRQSQDTLDNHLELVGSLQDSAEHHGADDDGYCVEHGGEAALESRESTASIPVLLA